MIPRKRSMIVTVAGEQRSMIESPTLDATGATKKEEAASSLRLTRIDALATNKALQQTFLEDQLSQSPAPPATVSPPRIETKNSVALQQGSPLSSEERPQRSSPDEQQRRIDAAIALQSFNKLITRDANKGTVVELHNRAAARKASTEKANVKDAVAKSALERANKLSEIDANLERCRIEKLLLEQQQLVRGCPFTPQSQRSSRTTQYQTPFPPPAPVHRFHPFPAVQPARHTQQVAGARNRFYFAAPMLPMIQGQFAEERHHFSQGSYAQSPYAPQSYNTHNMPPIPFVPNMAARAPLCGYFAQSDEDAWNFREKGPKEKELLEQHLRLNQKLLRLEQRTKTNPDSNGKGKSMPRRVSFAEGVKFRQKKRVSYQEAKVRSLLLLKKRRGELLKAGKSVDNPIVL